MKAIGLVKVASAIQARRRATRERQARAPSAAEDPTAVPGADLSSGPVYGLSIFLETTTFIAPWPPRLRRDGRLLVTDLRREVLVRKGAGVAASITVARLAKTLDSFDAVGASALCDDFIASLLDTDEPVDTAVAREILAILRRGAQFELLGRVADALVQTGLRTPFVQQQLAQALIDQGMVAAGVAVLDALTAETNRVDDGALEAQGLFGRAYKQMYLTAGPGAPERRAFWMCRAISAYEQVYAASREDWHGVNVAALLLRAQRDGLSVAGHSDLGSAARAIADDVVARVLKRQEGDLWASATLFEAYLALGDVPEAMRWLRTFVADELVGAFELRSLHRQLVELWQLTPEVDPGTMILPPLAAALLRKQGGSLNLSDPTALSGNEVSGFEKTFGEDGILAQRWFEEMLVRCRSVALIQTTLDSGTGFLVRGADLHPELPSIVLLTNNHVLATADAAREARVLFLGLPTVSGAVGIKRFIWTSPRTALDTTVLELDTVPAGAEPTPIAPEMPVRDAQPPSRTYVIGHPRGSATLKISIQHNHLLDYDDTRVHYRTPTEEGSSGSPVFDDAWRVLAIHHRGLDAMPKLGGTPGTYAANEGIRLDSVRRELAAAPLPDGP